MAREIKVVDGVAFVPLTKGYVATIDASDVPLVDMFNWSALVSYRRDGAIRAVYAVRSSRAGGTRRMIMMHRVIAGTPDGLETDHKDCNGLNNRRENLRLATKSENNHNQRISSHNRSGFKGVSWSKAKSKWRAEIWLNGKAHWLGLHETLEAASTAYANASKAIHGDFGRVS